MAARKLSSTTVALGLGIGMALTLAGCGEDEPDHSAVCVDEATQVRVDDDRCDGDDHRGFVWFYYPIHVSAPAVGSTVKGTAGTYAKPAGGYSVVPAKGGFGTHSGTVSG
jgi:hypothetical protein